MQQVCISVLASFFWNSPPVLGLLPVEPLVQAGLDDAGPVNMEDFLEDLPEALAADAVLRCKGALSAEAYVPIVAILVLDEHVSVTTFIGLKV